MREIKFRAWDKLNNCMDQVDGDCLYIADDQRYEVYEKGGNNYNTYLQKDNVSYKYEIMQYIGFTDINGKEIYESDIVRVVDSYTEKGCLVSDFIGLIKYGNGSFYVSDSDETYSDYRMMDLEIEVIGNVFADSELLIDREEEE